IFVNSPRLFHSNGSVWLDVTSTVDTANHIICGNVTSFSPFAIFQAATPPAITSAGGATFTVGTTGTFAVTATGFPAPTIAASGALPEGVAFNSATGVLSGMPTTSGTFPITFIAHNGSGTDATQNFTLTVNQAPAITSVNNATFTVGTAASFTVTATG